MSAGLPGLLAAALVLATGVRVASASQPSDFCTGNPCVVSGAKNVDGGTNTLDFGATTDLVFSSSAVVTLLDGADPAFLARSIRLDPGSRFTKGSPSSYAHLGLFALDGDVTMLSANGVQARIDLGGTTGGGAEMDGQNVFVDGFINASGSGPYSNGAGISLSGYPGRVTVHGTLDAGDSGYIYITSNDGGIVADATMNVSDPYAGGQINIQSYGTGDVDVRGYFDIRGGDDTGGYLFVQADDGNVTLNGQVVGTGSTGNGNYTCSGDPTIELNASGSVALGAKAVMNGLGSQGCPSGYLIVEAGTTFTQLPGSTYSAIGLTHTYGGGGSIHAGGDIVLRSFIMTSDYSAGSLDVRSTGGAIQVLGNVDVSGPFADLQLAACDVNIASTAQLKALGQNGRNSIRAGETVTITGKMLAGGQNRIEMREGTPLIAGQIAPAPSFAVNPTIPDCRPSCVGNEVPPPGSCGDSVVQCGEQCDDGAANGTAGDRCTATCIELPPALRIPGGGSKPTDCANQWSAELGQVAVAGGLPKNAQSCTDNDPVCDSDPVAGRCRIALWDCVGAASAPLGCSATSVGSLKTLAPRATSHVPLEVKVHDALDGALQALGGGGPGEACTKRIDVDLPASKKPITLKVSALTGGGTTDTDTLKLTCVPAP